MRPMVRRAAFTLCLACLGAENAIAIEDAATRFFTAPARSLLEHAESFTPADTSSAISLLESMSWQYDDEGKLATTSVFAYRIRTPAGVNMLGGVYESWSPWYENKPRIRARVISSDGHDYPLDQLSLIEQQGASSQLVYSDERVLMGPIPHVAVGSVVVLETKRDEHRPYFRHGRVSRRVIGSSWPVLQTELELRVPRSMPAQFVPRRIPNAKPRRTESDGMVTWRLSVPALAPWTDPEPWMVPDSLGLPQVEFSTAKSWKEVATGYRDLLPAESEPLLPREELQRLFRDDRSRMDSLTSLVELLHRRVRYTAVSLGISGLVPERAPVTLARGYGDCKDKGMVLIRLLQQSGFRADLALLRTGFGPDVDPDLPGMGRFDHAIVRVAGAKPTWIDPTAAHVRPGQLPPGVEGRRVLVLTPGAEGLARLPAAHSEENRVTVGFVIQLAERGPARVDVTSRHDGCFDADLRGQVAEVSTQDLVAYFREDARVRCGAGHIDTFHVSDHRKLREPMTYGYRTSDGQRFLTAADGAGISVAWSMVLDRLESLTNVAAGPEADEPADTKRPSRTSDFWVAIPSVNVVRLEVKVPDGMAIASPPVEQNVALGPAQLRIRPHAEPGGLRLELELDSGPRRWTPAEFERFRSVADSLRSERGYTLFFDVTGYRLQKENRHREALAEFRRLAQAHPREALHHEQIGDVMLAVGLGEQAREAARRGLELEPGNARAHRQLGYVLLHSPLGQWMKGGADVAGARVALAKAVAMDSTDVLARKWLAMALQYDSDVRNRGPGSDLAGAITHLFHLRDRLANRDLDSELLLDLAAAERFTEILEMRPPAESVEPDPRAIELLAVAARDGVPAAVKRAERKYRDDRTQLLMAASLHAMFLRRYADADGLMDALGTGTPEAKALEPLKGRARLLTSLRPVPITAKTPKDAMERFFARFALGDDEKIKELVAPDSPVREDFKGSGSSMAVLRMQGEIGQMAIDLARTLDLVIEDDGARGHRVQVDPGNAVQAPFTFYFTPRGPELMVYSMPGSPDVLGFRALQLVDQGQLPAARKWLDWATLELPDTTGSDAGERLRWDWWLRNQDASERHRLRSAAAALVATGKLGARMVSILREESARAVQEEERAAFDLALAQALHRDQKWEESEQLMSRLNGRFPRSNMLLRLRVRQLHDRAAWEPARKLLQDALVQNPKDRTVLQMLAETESRSGNPAPGWNRWIRQLVADGRGSRENYNQYAWAWVARAAEPESALALARLACNPEENASYEALHTLAMALAMTGALGEAKRVLGLAMDRSAEVNPGSSEWLVVGRIARALGETEAARAAYRRVERDPAELNAENAVWALAQRELAALPR